MIRHLVFGGLTLAALLLPALPSDVMAHESGTVELTLDADQRGLQVDVDLVDLDYVMGLRPSGGDAITAGDLRRHEAAIGDYIANRVLVDECRLRADDRRLGVRESSQPRLVVDYGLSCAQKVEAFRIRSSLFDELANYRSVLRTVDGGQGRLQVLRDGEAVVSASRTDTVAEFVSFVDEGFRHILQGADHLVFLLLLVLPVAGRGTLRRRILSVAGIVTAFTVSHSITLTLSALGNISLPSAPIELFIAASVVLVAVMNVVGRIEKLAWPVAYAFGLIHGFGFAGAFSELAAGSSLRWTDLLAFNVGVEIGQVAVITVALLLFRVLEPQRILTRNLLPVGSVLAGAVGLFWIVERL